MTLQKGESHGYYKAQNNDLVLPCECEADEWNGTLGTPTGATSIRNALKPCGAHFLASQSWDRNQGG